MNTKTKKLLRTELLTTKELSAYLGVKEVTIKKWVERGKVDYVLKGRTYLFDRRDFRREAVREPGAAVPPTRAPATPVQRDLDSRD